MAHQELIKLSSVVLVSGGARGITAQCVIKLAERVPCKFILLGRSSVEVPAIAGVENCHNEAELKRRIMEDMQSKGEKPAPQKIQKVFKGIMAKREIDETLQAIQKAGGYAEYVSVDITNRTDVQQKLAEPIDRLGAVTGIIHGAGNLADKLIENKTISDFEVVFSPKINGLENLLASVPVNQLDFMVLFSSIVGFYGNVGQADYAMANEILNKTAHFIKHKYPSCHVVSIDWGPWDSGMVTPELKRAFEQQNVTVIPAGIGADILVEELLPSNHEAAQMVVGSAPQHILEESTELRHYEIKRRLSLDANPFLVDHRIGKYPVLPATCAATWIASSCEQLYPNHTFFTIENYKVLKGIVFDSNETNEYILDLKEVSKTPVGDIEFDALIWSKNKAGRPLYHYSLRLKLVKEKPSAPLAALPLNQVMNTALQPILGHVLYSNGTLFHGPTFQGVDQVLNISQSKLTTRCILPKIDEKNQGQFPVQTGNPFIYDAIVQSLLIWSQHFYQAPCLPSYMEKLEQYQAIPFDVPVYVTLEVTSQSDAAVVGNLIVQDSLGETFVRITGLQGTISQRLNKIIGAPSEMVKEEIVRS